MPEQQPGQQVPWGKTDTGMAKSEAAKLEGRTLRVPSPGDITVRFTPPWRGDIRQPYHTWILHYGFRVEGYSSTHVCRKMYGESYCPGCKAASRLYDRAAHKEDPLHSAASDVRNATRFLYNAIAGVGHQRAEGPNGPVLLSEVTTGEPTIQAYSANEQVHKALLRYQSDWGDYTDPFTGHDVQLARQASGKQDAKFAPTQVYMIQQPSCVSQQILDLMMKGLPELDKFYEPTAVEEFDKIAELYYQKSLEKVGMATGTQVSVPPMAGAPGVQGAMPAAPVAAGVVPVVPAGMASAPPPTPATAATVPAGAVPAGAVPAGAASATAPAQPPAQGLGENPHKALIAPNDARLVGGTLIPNCFGRYKPDDPDCQTCAYQPESAHVTAQLAAGQQPTLANFTGGQAAAAAPAPAADPAAVPAGAVPAQAPMGAPAPAQAAAPAQPSAAAAAGLVPNDQLDKLEESLMGDQPQQPPQ